MFLSVLVELNACGTNIKTYMWAAMPTEFRNSPTKGCIVDHSPISKPGLPENIPLLKKLGPYIVL